MRKSSIIIILLLVFHSCKVQETLENTCFTRENYIQVITAKEIKNNKAYYTIQMGISKFYLETSNTQYNIVDTLR